MHVCMCMYLSKVRPYVNPVGGFVQIVQNAECALHKICVHRGVLHEGVRRVIVVQELFKAVSKCQAPRFKILRPQMFIWLAGSANQVRICLQNINVNSEQKL